MTIAWLDARYTFSFNRYHDPAHMGYRDLRVLNEDRIQPGGGFGAHPHDNMEIVTWVLDGNLAHKDSTGGVGNLTPGVAQVMSAGTGIEHSEFNGSDRQVAHIIQSWIIPAKRDVEPRYADRAFSVESRTNRWQAIASPDPPSADDNAPLPIHQDATVYTSLLSKGASLTHELGPGRGAWLHVARGSVQLSGHTLNTGDAAAIENEPTIALTAAENSELLLFDLP